MPKKLQDFNIFKKIFLRFLIGLFGCLNKVRYYFLFFQNIPRFLSTPLSCRKKSYKILISQITGRDSGHLTTLSKKRLVFRNVSLFEKHLPLSTPSLIVFFPESARLSLPLSKGLLISLRR